MTDELVSRMVAYNAPDVRRINHALKVLAYARLIALGEGIGGDELAALEAAAVLHDIGIHEAERRHGSSAGHWQEREGPPIARAILAEVVAPTSIADRVCFLVGHHHSYAAIDGDDFRALVEADFVVNADEDRMGLAEIAATSRTVFRTRTGCALLRTLYPEAFIEE